MNIHIVVVDSADLGRGFTGADWYFDAHGNLQVCVSKLVGTARFFVEDIQRAQLGPDGVDKLVKATAELDGKKCGVREEKEGGSAGKAVTGARAKTLKGFDYAAVQISGDKVTRAKPFRAQCEAGNVYLVRGPWNEAYLQELCGFPTAKHDDQVDASSCAFNAVLLEPVVHKVNPILVSRS